MKLRRAFPFLVSLLGLAAVDRAQAVELPCEDQLVCPPEDFFFRGSRGQTYCRTSKLWFEAESLSGASGDVVGVTISLHYAPGFDLVLNKAELAVCHDPSVAELVGEPIYSEEVLERRPFVIRFFPVDEHLDPDPFPDGHRGHGFIAALAVMRHRAPVSGRMPLMTVYYRLIGSPGDVSGIRFCDATLVRMRKSCSLNGIADLNVLGVQWPLLSTGNLDGSLTIHDGPVTRPDRPPEPPPAKVYSEPPTSDDVNLRVRIGNALARPGESEVPLDVFVTTDLEYTGVVVPIDFDERYLEVARVEDNFLSGTAIIDNEDALPGAQSDEGFVVVASNLGGRRRIAAEGEEFHAATIYLDVLESAAGISETTLASRSVGGRVPDPHVLVPHVSGTHADPVEVTSEVGAVTIAHGLVAIRRSLRARRGDANSDGAFDISDPITVLGHLFLGEDEPLCPGAADQTGDGRLDISDPIRMLNVLFLGAPVPGDAEEVDCR